MAFIRIAVAACALLGIANCDSSAEERAEWLDSQRDKCTSMIFGRKATTFGYPVTTHANDCNNCDNRMAFVPKTMGNKPKPVFDNIRSLYPRVVTHGRAEIYEPLPDQKEFPALGYVPSKGPTFSLWESSYPLINSKGLAIGESTTAAVKILAEQEVFHVDDVTGKNGTALFTIAPLMGVAMERCSTAQCAIRLMGEMAEGYGFAGEEYGASEAVTVIDETEAWVFEITGDGKLGALWAAQRVPDDHVAVVANVMIIKEIDPKQPENFIFAQGLFETAQKLGLWNGEGAFNWAKVLSSPLPLPRYASLRQWRVLDRVANSQEIPNVEDPLDYPFSAPVDAPVTINDVFDLQRDHYEGTEFDMTQGALAGMNGNPNYEISAAEMKQVKGQIPRAISLHRTSYTMVATSEKPFPKVWYALDAPASSVFVPFYSQANEIDPSFGTQYGPQLQVFNRSTAFWAFDFVANWMNINYRNMSQEMVYPKRDELQKWVLAEAAKIEKEAAGHKDKSAQTKVLNEGQVRIQKHVNEEWWQLADELVVRYNDGYYNFPPGQPELTGPLPRPAWYMRMIGFDDSFYKPGEHWVQAAGVDALKKAMDGILLTATAPSSVTAMSVGIAAIVVLVTFCLGVVVGRRNKDSGHKVMEGYQAL